MTGPFFLPDTTDPTRSCAGDPAWRTRRDARPDPLTELAGEGPKETRRVK